MVTAANRKHDTHTHAHIHIERADSGGREKEGRQKRQRGIQAPGGEGREAESIAARVLQLPRQGPHGEELR